MRSCWIELCKVGGVRAVVGGAKSSTEERERKSDGMEKTER